MCVDSSVYRRSANKAPHLTRKGPRGKERMEEMTGCGADRQTKGYTSLASDLSREKIAELEYLINEIEASFKAQLSTTASQSSPLHNITEQPRTKDDNAERMTEGNTTSPAFEELKTEAILKLNEWAKSAQALEPQFKEDLREIGRRGRELYEDKRLDIYRILDSEAPHIRSSIRQRAFMDKHVLSPEIILDITLPFLDSCLCTSTATHLDPLRASYRPALTMLREACKGSRDADDLIEELQREDSPIKASIASLPNDIKHSFVCVAKDAIESKLHLDILNLLSSKEDNEARDFIVSHANIFRNPSIPAKLCLYVLLSDSDEHLKKPFEKTLKEVEDEIKMFPKMTIEESLSKSVGERLLSNDNIDNYRTLEIILRAGFWFHRRLAAMIDAIEDYDSDSTSGNDNNNPNNNTTSDIPCEIEIPSSFVFHSLVVCPVSHELIPQGEAVRLGCGHVISEAVLRTFFDRGAGKCPYCPERIDPDEVLHLRL